MNLIAHFQTPNSDVYIYRDKHGHWFVQNNGVWTQKKLNSSEIVRYLAHAANRI